MTKTKTCQPCDHARAEGWWGDPGITHCRDCHATWPQTRAYQHCVRCHQTFGGKYAADRHLNRAGNCKDPATVVRRNGKQELTRNDDGVWVRRYGE